MYFCCSIYIETAQNSREECNEIADLLFFRLSLCLLEALCPVTLAHYISVFYSTLYFYTSNTFRPILARFSHILGYTNCFLMYITTQNIFLIHDDAVARNLISAVKGLIWTIFFFLTFIALIQWNFPWNISANLLIFTNKALLFNKSESLECAKVVVLKLGAILFYSGIHFKPLKFWKKI